MHRRMIDFERFTPELLASEPYRRAFVGELFSPADAADLVNTFPRDHGCKRSTHARRLIAGSIVNNYHFYVAGRLKRALNCARQQVRASERWDN
jgi:hypothetical protein